MPSKETQEFKSEFKSDKELLLWIGGCLAILLGGIVFVMLLLIVLLGVIEWLIK